MPRVTVTVPVELEVDADRAGLAYARDLPGVSGYFATPAKARRVLRAQAIAKVRELAEHAERTDRVALGCADGRVLLVEHSASGAYGYTFAGPTCRGYSGAWGWDTFAEAVERAEAHAAESFGGVTWRTRF